MIYIYKNGIARKLFRFEDRFIDYGNRYRVYYKTFGFDQNKHRDDYIVVKKNRTDYLLRRIKHYQNNLKLKIKLFL